jgi:hypothetical protein
LPDRTIIVDANMPWRIADELVARGYRMATSPYRLGDQKMKDPPLLKLIHEKLEPATLVTFDNKMPLPGEHLGLLKKYRTTLAVIDQEGIPASLEVEEYWRDVIHRHAHQFADQPTGSRFKYRQAGRRRIP